MDSKALTKIQAVALVAIVLVAAVGGSAAYVLWSGQVQSAETIKIGVLGDLDNYGGKTVWQEVVLAVEQVNAAGGVLGRNFTVVAEDDDSLTPPYDTATAVNALTKLITVDKADYIVNSGGFSLVYQEIISQHKVIMLDGFTSFDELTQKVLDDYGKYKYYFRVGSPNATSSGDERLDSISILREYTGFNKIAYVSQDTQDADARIARFSDTLRENGFDVVYTAVIPLDVVDFSSYFALAENAGAEIFQCDIVGPACVPLVKEYYDRQSPMVLWGLISMVSQSDFWELTDGKCEAVSSESVPTVAGYHLTNKTVQFREAYIERWGEDSQPYGAFYDAVRYILPDAIRRAGTTETEAVIKALESTDIETSLARHFVFTSSHDIMVGQAGPDRSGEDYFIICIFQWQNGELVPVYPKWLMEEAGATYKYPPWHGPWSK